MVDTEEEEHYELLYKMIIIGDTCVGKSNILSRYIRQEFTQDTKSTVGVELGIKFLKVKNVNAKIQIWDTIGPKDLVVTITANKKKIKRVNPNAYLNESYEYLSHNILILSKDQAGCRYLQKKLEKEPQIATNYFYEAMQPYLTQVMKDPFGNYLIQKIIKNLDDKRLKKIIEAISSSIVEIGTNNHGTRVIQFLISCLTTRDLQDYFVEIIKPHTIQLLKELNGAHIIQKVLLEFPDSCDDINKIIIDNFFCHL